MDIKMARMKRTYPAFTFIESVRILKKAFPRYFQNYTPDLHTGETAALLAMLEKGCILCSHHDFQPVETLPAELQSEAERIAEVLRKKTYARVLRNVLHVFSEYRPDLSRSKCGALFYPELKLYACVGYLTPKNLLRLFADPDCEQVAVLVITATWKRKSHYLLFERGGSWEEYIRLAKSFDLAFPELRSLRASENAEPALPGDSMQ
jgi:hypothetical protein